MDIETNNVQHSNLPSTSIKEDNRSTYKKGRLQFFITENFERSEDLATSVNLNE